MTRLFARIDDFEKQKFANEAFVQILLRMDIEIVKAKMSGPFLTILGTNSLGEAYHRLKLESKMEVSDKHGLRSAMYTIPPRLDASH